MKAVKTAAALIAAVCVILAGIRIYSVNRRFPQLRAEDFAMGESAEIRGFEVRLTSLEAGEPSDFGLDEKYGDERILVAEIEIKNIEDEAADFPTFRFTAKCGAWSNSARMNMFEALNGFKISNVKISKGEAKTVRLGYVMTKNQFTEKQWDNIASARFLITFLDYPEKYVFNT